MMYKYLYEKDYKNNNIYGNIERKLFNSVEELLKYMEKQDECIFNAGCHSAEVRLNRIEVEKDDN